VSAIPSLRGRIVAACLFLPIALSSCTAVMLPTAKNTGSTAASPSLTQMPAAYTQAGLESVQAANILLDRFTFGARPGDFEAVLKQGLPQWFAAQLHAAQPESTLQTKLADIDTFRMSDAEIMATFPSFSAATAHIRRFYPGVLPPRDEPVVDFTLIANKLAEFAKTHNMHRMEDRLLPELYGQKILHAVYAQNQLQEVMVDFWQNHFFTSTSNFGSRGWVLGFERDVLRPAALTHFTQLLQNSTKHPAMLEYYRHDARPTELEQQQTLMAVNALEVHKRKPLVADKIINRAKDILHQIDSEYDLIVKRQFWANTGPNLARARSLLELQTLGPNAKTAEADILATARILTGWTVFPYGASDQWFAVNMADAEPLGFVRQDSLWFRADHHDAGEKVVLGHHFAAGQGVDEGERLLNLLAEHPDTAHHIARKLVARFAGDTASPALVDKLASAYRTSSGDIKTLLTALVTAPEFWQAAARHNKLKPPFYYAISALRAKQVDIQSTQTTVDWITRMGQPLYGYQEPTGYPEEDSYWLDTGSLLARIGFAHQLEQEKINGVAITGSNTPVLSVTDPDFQLH